jgi:hypothetical protein
MNQKKVERAETSGRLRRRTHYPGRSYEEQWAQITFPTLGERRLLAQALTQLKDATELDAWMALSLFQAGGLDNALAFIADLARLRTFEPPPIAADALVLLEVPRSAQTREEVYAWARKHIPLTDACLIWGNWQQEWDRSPIIYVRLLPFVAFWLIYEACVGQVPDGMDLELSCGDYRCVNPRHVQLVPLQEHEQLTLPAK